MGLWPAFNLERNRCCSLTSNLIGNRTEFTRLLKAFQTADTILLVGTLIKLHAHRATVIAGLAVGASLRIVGQPEDAVTVKK